MERDLWAPWRHSPLGGERLKGGGQAGALAPFLSLGSQQIKVDAAPFRSDT